MKIQQITNRSRRDFTAVMECEHCGDTIVNNSGYDDAYYHSKVIPSMKCSKCGEKGKKDSIPATPKYGSHEII